MKKHKRRLGWPEWTLVGIVATSALAIAVVGISQLFSNPIKRAESELEMLADEYYTTYLYPRLLGNSKSVDDAFQTYAELGVPTIYLRQLLHFDNNRYADSGKVFENLACDTNLTGVHYYPRAPYGPRDYDVTYLWHCNTTTEK